MYAIVEIAGLQYKVEQDQRLYVNRLQGKEGDAVSFDKVLLTDNGSVTVGAPVISGISVEAKILGHVKGDKVIVFKKKRRKGYQKSNGHRQQFTQIEVLSIGGSKGAAKKAKADTKTTEKVEKSNAESKKVAAKAAKKEDSPKTASKKAATKGNDDLKKIEGVGPKAAEALVNAGVSSFALLSKKSADEIKEILTSASSRLASLDPTTWADQAKLAADGKWDELKKWQDELDGGRA